MYTFPTVSLLITHYNRSESLANLLLSFRNLNCQFGEIVVSDDGSKTEHLEKIKVLQKEYDFNLVTTPANRGLGHNINKGQDAVTKNYTLYIQEDFEPATVFAEKFTEALRLMDEKQDLDIVKFYAYYAYPYLKPFNADYDEMYLPPFGTDYTKIYFYTDHPHLRRTTFFQKFGRYPEGLKGDLTEYKMCISFLQQKGKGLFYKDFANLFLQKNSEDEPSTMTRQSWKAKNSSVIKVVRYVYRQVKYNYDILYQKSLKRV
ncbi:glycosyltransferase [Pedobacter sandarakinus]|uniref:glycosyltransferase n=1 Tax=Pedobacter sandarakinus TaxID=353156 RepID=UPI00224799C9|nr:glycosyltransferase [Pedobacter sandarakinus]MCX2574878.1 glycosyltransferase [Pedobacter sandarakinus]